MLRLCRGEIAAFASFLKYFISSASEEPGGQYFYYKNSLSCQFPIIMMSKMVLPSDFPYLVFGSVSVFKMEMMICISMGPFEDQGRTF